MGGKGSSRDKFLKMLFEKKAEDAERYEIWKCKKARTTFTLHLIFYKRVKKNAEIDVMEVLIEREDGKIKTEKYERDKAQKEYEAIKKMCRRVK